MDGYYLFPLEEDAKVPEGGHHWKKRSTVDIEVIKSWFYDSAMERPRNPNIGIDCGKSGLYVIDVDVKDGKRGDQTLAKLKKERGLTPTLEAVTPTGGRHLIYKNTADLRNTVEVLGQGIDTRGVGGYIVAPGSYIEDEERGVKGFYKFANKREVAELDEWVGKKLAEYRFVSDKSKGKTLSEDDAGDIDRAIAWLEDTAKHAIEGEGGDHITYATAAKLREFGCSEDTALQLMLDHWNEQCEPPWDADDLEVKVQNAYRHGQKATGLASAEAEFEHDVPASALKTKKLAPRARFTPQPFDLRFSVDRVPPREWLFADLALAKKVTVIVAPGGAGKSTFSLSMAISKATGRNLLDMSPIERGAVWIWNNEDDMEEMQRRAGAIMQNHGVPVEELFDEDVKGDEQRCLFFMNSGEEERFRIARKEDGEIRPDGMKAAIKHIRENDIKLWIVDPLVSTHPANENDNNEIETIADMYRTVAQVTGCAVILIHHTKKLQDASSDGHEGNMDTLRGASALSGVARIIATFFGMSTRRAKEFGVPDEMRWKYVGLMMAKANMSAATAEIRWFEKIGERIGVTEENMDGEDVGVLRPVKLTKDNSEKMKDANRELLYDIESECNGETILVSTLAASLVANYPMQQGKQAKSLEKAILRMFDHGTLSFMAKYSRLDMIERPSTKPRGPRTVAAVRAVPVTARNTPEEEDLM
jgi:hypothetical protein